MKPDPNVWEYFQTETPGVFEGNDSRLAFLSALFGKSEKVLNIGAGNGRFEELCLARGIDVYSLDPGPRTIEELRKKFGLGEKAVAGYSQAIPFPAGHFDAVVVSEVLEHLEDGVLRKTLEEAARVLRPGGKFAGTVPEAEQLEEERCVCPKCGEKFHKWGHLQSFTAARLRAELGEHFTLLRMESKFFAPWNILNWKGKAQALGRLLMFKAGLLGPRRRNLFFYCVKK